MADKDLTNDITTAGALTGTELVHCVQSGNSRGTTTQNIRDLTPTDTDIIPTFHGCRVVEASDDTAQDYTSNPDLTWDTDTFDTDAFHDTVSNTERITIPSDFNGMYGETNGTVYLDAVTADEFVILTIVHFDSVDVVKGLFYQGSEIGNTTSRITLSTGPVLLATGDYFVIRCQVESDTSVTRVAARSSFSFKVLGQ